MDCIGPSNPSPTLGSDPESLECRGAVVVEPAAELCRASSFEPGPPQTGDPAGLTPCCCDGPRDRPTETQNP